MTVAKNDDALEGSIADAERISFMSYLKGASFWVFSIDCLLLPTFGLGFGFLLFLLSDAGLPAAGAALLTVLASAN